MFRSAISGKADSWMLFKALLCFWFMWVGTWTLLFLLQRSTKLGIDKINSGPHLLPHSQCSHSDIGRRGLGTAQPEGFVPVPALSQENTLSIPPSTALQLYPEKYKARIKMWEKREGREGSVTKCSSQGVAGEGESLALLPGVHYTFYTVYHHHHRKHHWEIVLFSSCRVPESHLFPICCRSYWGGCVRQAGLPSGLWCLWWGRIWS